MREWLNLITENVVLVIDGLALVVVVAGTIEAFVKAMGLMFTEASGHERREVWLRFARSLVAGLTFQLAADILESATTTGWDAVGRLAAIAVIRTFLNYFLERDLSDVRQREHGAAKA